MISLLISVIIYPRISAVDSTRSCVLQHHSPVNWTADCSSNRLTQLPVSLEGLPITGVILRYNHLNSTVNFKNWTSLRWIDLAHNDVEFIPDLMFSEFKDLKGLNLSSNSLQSISGDYVVNKLYVESLDLSHNYQLSAHKYFLDNLRKIIDRGVKLLSLRATNLKWLPEYYFARSYELKNLDLSQNQLKELPSFPVSLIQLDISGNQFARMGLTQFRDTADLEVLKAENNRFLREISEDAFYYSRKLEQVFLKGNMNLTEIPEELFTNNHLKYLSLADCGFKALSPSFKESFNRFNYIDLRNNPWECDHRLEWFLQLKCIVNDDQLRCSNTGASFSEFFETTIDHRFLNDILIALMFVIVILFGLSIWFVYSLEFRKKVKNLYSPLDSPVTLGQPVYVSTVRRIES